MKIKNRFIIMTTKNNCLHIRKYLGINSWLENYILQEIIENLELFRNMMSKLQRVPIMRLFYEFFFFSFFEQININHWFECDKQTKKKKEKKEKSSFWKAYVLFWLIVLFFIPIFYLDKKLRISILFAIKNCDVHC